MSQYVPMMSNAFAAKLAPAQTKLILDLWQANIADYRKGSAASQANARAILEKNGVKFHDPSADEAAAVRKRMMGDIQTLIKDAKLSPEVVSLVKDAVGSSA
jgi:TRAP-type C4-dicarboxylate transport system substrate-binding protein